MRTTAPGQSALLLLDIIDAVNERGIDYVIIGAFAASFYGVVRATLDADAVISLLSSGDIKEICLYFKSIGLKAGYKHGDMNDPIGGIIHIEDGFHNRVDLLMGIQGMKKKAFGRSRKTKFMGSLIKIVGLEDFIALKIYAGSPKDLDDIRGVLEISKKSVNLKSLMAITEGFGKIYAAQLKSILNNS